MIAEKQTLDLDEQIISGDENQVQKLITTCTNLQDQLLTYANYKPTKKDQQSFDKTSKLENNEVSFKILINKILEFK